MTRHDLAARRRAAGLSQEGLAELLQVDRTTVGRWEQGTSLPQPWNRRPLAGALGVSLGELDRLLAAPGGAGLRWQDDGMDRRTFLAAFGGSLAAALMQLEHAAVAGRSEGQRRSALRLLGHAHQEAGESAFDRLDLGAAADHLRQAHEIGAELGDADMIANALIELGDLARRRRRYDQALRLLASAERHATAAGTLTQLRRGQSLARAHAELGARTAFERAIGEAERLAATMAPEHHRDGDHSPRGVRLERGQGLTLLGRPGAALAIYEQISPASLGGERELGSFRIIQAQALAHAGHLDEGVRVALDGLALARGYGSPRHVSRVERMHERLVHRWSPSEPALAGLRDALAA